VVVGGGGVVGAVVEDSLVAEDRAEAEGRAGAIESRLESPPVGRR
jgi:hypothetical protein